MRGESLNPEKRTAFGKSENIKAKQMRLKRLIVILMICLLLGFIFQSIGSTMGYFTDSESSVDNTLRIVENW